MLNLNYARNYLFPRNLAVPCNEFTLAHFESRKEEIEAKKDYVRQWGNRPIGKISVQRGEVGESLLEIQSVYQSGAFN